MTQISISTKTIPRYMFGANFVIVAAMCNELSCGESKLYRQTKRWTDVQTDLQMQSTMITVQPERPRGKNQPKDWNTSNVFFVRENILFHNVILSTIMLWPVILNLNMPNKFLLLLMVNFNNINHFRVNQHFTLHICLHTEQCFFHNWYFCTLNIGMVNGDMMQSWWGLTINFPTSEPWDPNAYPLCQLDRSLCAELTTSSRRAWLVCRGNIQMVSGEGCD